MKKQERPTLKTISEITGLAVTTVSRALSGAPEIALKTRKRVGDVAEEIGYIPDRAAQRLRTGKTKVISLIIGEHQEALGFGNSLIVGLTRRLRATGYHLNITPSFNNEDPLAAIQSIVRNNHSDGVIFTRTEPFDNRIRYLLEKQFPFISHGRSEFATPHAYVDFDSQEFSYQAVKRLVERGSKKVCIILPASTLTYGQFLHTGFMRACREFNVDFEIPNDIDLDNSPDEIRQWLNDRLDSSDCPTGFVCPGESAYLAINSALHDKMDASTIANRFSIVAKSTSNLLDQLSHPIDQISEDIEMAGETLADHLLNKLITPNQETYQTILSPKLKFSPLLSPKK